MQIVAQQVGPDLAICQGGIGPIVTLWMGPNSAPAAIADAPIVASPETSDLFLINRNGSLQQIPWGDVIAAAAADAAAAAIAAVATDLSAITGSLTTLGTDVTTLTSDVGTLQADFATVVDLSTPEGLVAALNGAIEASAVPFSRPSGSGIFINGETLSFQAGS